MKSALTGIHKNNGNMHRHESRTGQDRQNDDSQETSKFRRPRSFRFQDTAFGKVKITSSAHSQDKRFIILRYSVVYYFWFEASKTSAYHFAMVRKLSDPWSPNLVKKLESVTAPTPQNFRQIGQQIFTLPWQQTSKTLIFL